MSMGISCILDERYEPGMNDQAKAEIEELETLRELALCGPEEKRDEAQRAYEELRTKLLSHEQCETHEQTNITKDLEYGR
jgi:hypothetical protein